MILIKVRGLTVMVEGIDAALTQGITKQEFDAACKKQQLDSAS